MPPPRRRGRGQGRGTVSSYPAGTVAQVRMLLRLIERHRNLDKVAVLLKINGYTVSVRACRRAVEHLVLNPLDDLDPHRSRNERAPEVVATAAARRALSRRVRTEEERTSRSSDQTRAGGRDRLISLGSGLLLPLYGGFDQAAYIDFLERFGLGEAFRKINSAVPGLGESLGQEALEGGMQIDRIRTEALPQLTADNYDTFVRMCRVLLAALEAFGVEISASDSFAADCLAALRRPERRLNPAASSDTGEAEGEAAALAFFARRQRTNVRATARTGGSRSKTKSRKV
jgi:hypothetical protein